MLTGRVRVGDGESQPGGDVLAEEAAGLDLRRGVRGAARGEAGQALHGVAGDLVVAVWALPRVGDRDTGDLVFVDVVAAPAQSPRDAAAVAAGRVGRGEGVGGDRAVAGAHPPPVDRVVVPAVAAGLLGRAGRAQ